MPVDSAAYWLPLWLQIVYDRGKVKFDAHIGVRLLHCLLVGYVYGLLLLTANSVI